jgi:hypothetical protein
MPVDMSKLRAAHKRAGSKWGPDDIVGGEDYRGETVGVSYERIEHVTSEAALLVIEGEKKWCPKSLIREADEQAVIVAKFWAEKNGVEAW